LFLKSISSLQVVFEQELGKPAVWAAARKDVKCFLSDFSQLRGAFLFVKRPPGLVVKQFYWGALFLFGVISQSHSRVRGKNPSVTELRQELEEMGNLRIENADP
jgi:hypothetical protein